MRVGEMTGRMRWAGSIALVAAALATAGCTLLPPSETDGPGEPAPTPVAVEQLAERLHACGAVPEAQELEPDYDAEAAALGASGTVVEVSVDVEPAADDHGSHGLGPTDVLVVRRDEVVGVVVGETWAEEPDGAAGTVALDVRACPPDGVPTAPLADGEVTIWLRGALDPLDHAHARAELWAAQPLTVTVADGALQP